MRRGPGMTAAHGSYAASSARRRRAPRRSLRDRGHRLHRPPSGRHSSAPSHRPDIRARAQALARQASGADGRVLRRVRAGRPGRRRPHGPRARDCGRAARPPTRTRRGRLPRGRPVRHDGVRGCPAAGECGGNRRGGPSWGGRIGARRFHASTLPSPIRSTAACAVMKRGFSGTGLGWRVSCHSADRRMRATRTAASASWWRFTPA